MSCHKRTIISESVYIDLLIENKKVGEENGNADILTCVFFKE